jgi:hypothetical protein
MWLDQIISNSDLYPRELFVDIINRLGSIKQKLENRLHDPFEWEFDDCQYDMVNEDIELPMGEEQTEQR